MVFFAPPAPQRGRKTGEDELKREADKYLAVLRTQGQANTQILLCERELAAVEQRPVWPPSSCQNGAVASMPAPLDRHIRPQTHNDRERAVAAPHTSSQRGPSCADLTPAAHVRDDAQYPDSQSQPQRGPFNKDQTLVRRGRDGAFYPDSLHLQTLPRAGGARSNGPGGSPTYMSGIADLHGGLSQDQRQRQVAKQASYAEELAAQIRDKAGRGQGGVADRAIGKAMDGAGWEQQRTDSRHMQPCSPTESSVHWDQQAQQAQYSERAQHAEHAQHGQETERALQAPASAPQLQFLSRGSADAQLLHPAAHTPLVPNQEQHARGGFMQSMAELRPGLSREQRGQAEAARQQLVLDLEQQIMDKKRRKAAEKVAQLAADAQQDARLAREVQELAGLSGRRPADGQSQQLSSGDRGRLPTRRRRSSVLGSMLAEDDTSFDHAFNFQQGCTSQQLLQQQQQQQQQQATWANQEFPNTNVQHAQRGQHRQHELKGEATSVEALLEEMRAEQRRQSELIELQASALHHFRTGALQPATPVYNGDREEQYSYAKDDQGELMAVRSVLLPLDSSPAPVYGDHTSQSQGVARKELMGNITTASRQDRKPEGVISHVSGIEIGAGERRIANAKRQAGGRKSSQQAGFGSSTTTGRHHK